MTLSKNGVNAFQSEVTNISSSGFWLLVDDREHFVPFEDYPAFKKATVEQIYQFQQLSPEQFRWEELDIDIELNALKHPEQYLLKFQRERNDEKTYLETGSPR